jgi:uncharacterized protein with HEPN domain
MTLHVLVYIDDMLESITRIECYLSGLAKETFEADQRTQDAVLRRLEIIGEASRRIPESFKDKYPDVAWNKAIGMRNILIHEYDDLSPDIIWETLRRDIPRLKTQLLNVLASEGSSGPA